ncbi:adhesion G protein-coupled receptor F5 [Ctenodactylus gundi]
MKDDRPRRGAGGHVRASDWHPRSGQTVSAPDKHQSCSVPRGQALAGAELLRARRAGEHCDPTLMTPRPLSRVTGSAVRARAPPGPQSLSSRFESGGRRRVPSPARTSFLGAQEVSPLLVAHMPPRGPVSGEYVVDVEVGFENASFLDSLKAQLNSLHFPIERNGTNPAPDILSVDVTTVPVGVLSCQQQHSCIHALELEVLPLVPGGCAVGGQRCFPEKLAFHPGSVCRPTGGELRCSCEPGYEWPRESCLQSPTCPERGGVPSGPHCSCLSGLPPRGPFCQLPGGVTLKMKVRLNVGFQEDLRNTSSALYRSYKSDLERAFWEGYRILPGFKSAAVTGFTNGSVVVNYEVKTTTLSPGHIQRANEHVQQSLNQTYRLDEGSFQGVASNETKFTVTPEVILEGDTVVLECENDVLSPNMSWFFGEGHSLLQNDSKVSIQNTLQHNLTSVSRLTITNVTAQDSGLYSCKLILDIFEFGNARYINVTPVEILAHETMEVECGNRPVSLSCCSASRANWSSVQWTQEGHDHVPGHPETDLNLGCSNYTINATTVQCPTTVTYTCEFLSYFGARGSRSIVVNFTASLGDEVSSSGAGGEHLWPATEASTAQSTSRSSPERRQDQHQPATVMVTPDPIAVSEGQGFRITCTSTVSDCDEAYWETAAGVRIHDRFHTTRRQPSGVESVLTVRTSTREWNGTYHCIFKYKGSYSNATKDVTVYPLPLPQNIMVDPLGASALCQGAHLFRCCIEEDEDYRVTIHIGPHVFSAEKEVLGKQVCYSYSFPAKSVSQCPKTITAFCHFVNAANGSVQSQAMKLTLISGENVTCRDPAIGFGEPGKVIQKLCQFAGVPTSPGMGGLVTYECVGSQWKAERKGCISAPINGLLQVAKALVKSPSQNQKLPTYLKDLSMSTGQEEQAIRKSPGSLGAIISILDLLSTVPTQVNSDMMKDVLATVNVILSKSVLGTWEDLQQRQANQSSQLLHSMERFSRALRLGDSASPFPAHPNVQIKTMVVKPGRSPAYHHKFVFADSDLWGNVTIDECQLGNLQPESSVVTVAFPTLKAILAQEGEERPVANSLVLTTTVSHGVAQPFHISMTFQHRHRMGGPLQCVFWNFSLSNHTGGWDSSGCRVSHTDRDSVTCACNHLTSFSILMSPDSPDRGSLLEILLDIISYIGLGFSILSLAACLVIEAVVWKSVTKNRTSYMRHVCIVNIAASLFFADTWFVVAAAIQGHRYPLNETACVAATFFIHFLYLSVFFWMLTLGLMLLYRLIFILHDASKSAQKAAAFSLGYGCPLLIAVITVGATQPREVYTRKNACWLNWEDTKALLAFAVPALVIVVVNMTVTAVVISKILRPSVGDKPHSQERSGLFQISKSLGVLTPLLGLTWGFGLATVFQGSSAVFHIIFTLLNAFQGLFILLFGCLWDQKVQEALLNRYSRSKWSSQHSKSTSLASSTPVFSMSSPISRRFNNLFGKTGTYNVSTPETTSSSVENSSSAYSLLN